MKILHICALSGTVKELLLPQINYLLSCNYSVEIACSPGIKVEELQRQNYIVHPIQIDRKISPLRNLKTILALAKLIKENQYDLVHVHTPIAAVLGRIAAKLAGAKNIVYTSHGLPFYELSPPWEYMLYFSVEKFCAKFTDLILSQNHEDIHTAKTRGLCPPEKLRYLGNGVDLNLFNRDRLDSVSQKELRKSLGIPDTANLIIGTIGRLTRKKGIQYLVEATSKLIPQFPNLHILVIGGQLNTDPEPCQAEIMEKIYKLGLENHITLTGYRQDIPNLLGLLDIFTLPTFTHEGLPRSIVEAMAMSLPVVTTNIRGCREVVTHNQTGLIVPHQNSEKLADALSQLLADAELRKAQGKAGRERVEDEYNEIFVFEKLKQYYQELGIYSSIAIAEDSKQKVKY